MPKTIVIIQARTGSSRLPGKVLFELEGRAILEHVMKRCQAANVGEVIVATTTSFEDLQILNICAKMNVPCFCGSESDVLDRFVRCASKHNADHVVRITADCSMIDPKIIDRTVYYYFNKSPRADYCASRMIPWAYPDGMDVEIFNFRVLKSAARNATSKYDREHVTTWIKRNKKLVRVNLPSDRAFDEKMEFSIDTREDYEYAKEIYRLLYPKNPLFGLAEIEHNFINWKTMVSSIILKEETNASNS
jgi:spore coat polysaccharide biosynthesis protein SpsF